MVNVIAPIIVVGFLVLVIVAYRKSKKTRQELIAEMKEEILSNEPAPVEQPAPVVAEVKEAVEAIVEIAKAEVEATKAEIKAVKAEVKELIATQESAATKPKRKRPAKKKPTQN